MKVLEVRQLGKAFRKYRSDTRRIFSWFGFSPGHVQKHWVLKDISFSLNRGESLALVGQNGAGKSTLLKLISGVQKPVEGVVSSNGRISAILELGLGFNPDFSGRQNVTHSLGLSGYNGKQIKRFLPEVEAFAEIGGYFDQPVRTYSSGMQVRLAFAVATVDRPDLLIVDEALAVGDAAFQRKCFRRIESFRAAGSSLLFVSHDIEAVKRLCDRAIFLRGGTVVAMGAAKQVCDLYEESLSEELTSKQICKRAALSVSQEDRTHFIDSEREYGDEGATIISVQIRNEHCQPAVVIKEESQFQVVYTVEFHIDCFGVGFGIMLKTVDGIPVYGTNTGNSGSQHNFERGQIAEVRFVLQGNVLPGDYFLNVSVTHLVNGAAKILHRRVDCAMVRISSVNSTQRTGYANLFAANSVKLLSSRGQE